MPPTQYCGQCGAHITAENARFCGECGAAIATTQPPEQSEGPKRINPEAAAPKPEPQAAPKQEAPPEPTVSPEGTFALPAAITVAWQTSLAWVVGWLPIGFLFSGFYARKQILNPAWYEQYPLGWDATLAGMTLTYSLGALVGGFLAGFILYTSLRTKALSLGALAALPAIGWFLLMGASLWALTQPIKHIGDGDLLIAIPIMAVVYGGLLAWLLVKLLGKKYGAAITPARLRSAVIGWGACGLAAFFCAMVVAGFLE